VTTISRRDKKIISKPQVTSRGFVFQKTSRDILQESANIVEEEVLKNLELKDFEWAKLKNDNRESLSRYLYDQTKRRPVILPVIMEASNKK
jgi:ribonuclease J